MSPETSQGGWATGPRRHSGLTSHTLCHSPVGPTINQSQWGRQYCHIVIVTPRALFLVSAPSLTAEAQAPNFDVIWLLSQLKHMPIA